MFLPAVFLCKKNEDANQENVYALSSAAYKAFLAFNNGKVVSKQQTDAATDFRIHVFPTGELAFESETWPGNFISVAANGLLIADNPLIGTSIAKPNQLFTCYVKGCFRHQGVLMLCTSIMQTLCIDRDPRVMTANGKRNRLAHFRCFKVDRNIRMFESIVFPGRFLQVKDGECSCEGKGDKYSEFRIKRTKNSGFVVLESIREKSIVGFLPNGQVKADVDRKGALSPNVRIYPEVIECK